MRKLRVVLLAVALVAAVATVYFVYKGEKRKQTGSQTVLKTARIGYQKTILYLPLFVAKEQGFFSKHGVDVELVNFTSAPDMMQALLSGQIDASGMSALDVIANVEQERPGLMKLYLIEAFEPGNSPDFIISRHNAGIKSIFDLKGKKLAVRPGITFETFAKLILERSGVGTANVEMVKLSEDLQLQALGSGQIDAVFTFDPTARTILDKGIGELVEQGVSAKYLMGQPTTIYPGSGVLSADFVRRDSVTAKAVRDAIYEAVDYIVANPQEAKRLLPKYTPIASHIAEQVSLIKWVKVKDLDKEKVQDLISLYLSHGVLNKDINLREAYLTEAELK